MLPKLMLEKITEQKLTYREVGSQVGISHMTVSRIMRGGTVDLDTLDAIARWLGVPLAVILEARAPDTDEGFMGEVQLLSAMNPEFKAVFQELFAKVANGEVDSRVLGDVVAYARFRLSQAERGSVDETANAGSKGNGG